MNAIGTVNSRPLRMNVRKDMTQTSAGALDHTSENIREFKLAGSNVSNLPAHDSSPRTLDQLSKFELASLQRAVDPLRFPREQLDEFGLYLSVSTTTSDVEQMTLTSVMSSFRTAMRLSRAASNSLLILTPRRER